MWHLPYKSIGRTSSHNTAAVKPAGLPKYSRINKSGNQKLKVTTHGYNARSWEVDPRQLGHRWATGTEQHLHLNEDGLDKPTKFWQAHGHPEKKGAGIALGIAKGKPGELEGPIEWTPIKGPSLASRATAKASTALGRDRCWENVVECRPSGQDSRDVTMVHISDIDRRLVVINHENWQEQSPQRQALVEKLRRNARLLRDPNNEYHLSKDGKTLTVIYGTLKDKNGRRVRDTYDVSCLNLDPRQIYQNAGNQRHTLRLIMPDEFHDFESLGTREVASMHNEAIRTVDQKVVRMIRDQDTGEITLHLDTHSQSSCGKVLGARLDDGSTEIKITTNQGNQVRITAQNEDALRQNDNFQNQTAEMQQTILNAFQEAQRETITAKTWGQIKKSSIYRARNLGILERSRIRLAIGQAFDECLDFEKVAHREHTAVAPRFGLQFHRYRTTTIKNALPRPVGDNESVYVVNVQACAEVTHLDETNGRTRGFKEVVPLNFRPEIRPDLLIHDSRREAVFNSKAIHPINATLAGQHLLPPFVWGKEMFSAWGPEADQKGFFGLSQLSASAFPYGATFTGSENHPWYLKATANTSGGIFANKAEAGRKYGTLAGTPKLSKESTGAAMITGPNLCQICKLREGKIFFRRLPNREGKPTRHEVIITSMAGFFILNIEDCQDSVIDMVWFGARTEGLDDVDATGGGLENYQAAVVQRGKRWNSGLDIDLMQIAEVRWQDLTRGTTLYKTVYGAVVQAQDAMRRVSGKPVPLVDTTRIDAKSALEASARAKQTHRIKKRPLTPKTPLLKQLKLDEHREHLNTGTWYWVGPKQMVLYAASSILVLSSLLPITAVGGPVFLLASIAMTLLSWPFWAGVMARQAVNPKYIIGMKPSVLFWQDSAMVTQFLSGKTIERMGVGKFIVTIKDQGNEFYAVDKRGMVTLGGAASVAGVTLFFGSLAIAGVWWSLTGLALTTMPMLVGVLASRFLHRFVRRRVPNPNRTSFLKSALHWSAKAAPVAVGLLATALFSQAMVVLAVSLATAIMAGFWSMFMGYNIFNVMYQYHKEHQELFKQSAPNPHVSTVPQFKEDTFRHTLRQVAGREEPDLTTYEFQKIEEPGDNMQYTPQALQATIKNKHQELATKVNNQEALTFANALISGQAAGDRHQMFDLLDEFKDSHSHLLTRLDKYLPTTNPLTWWRVLTRFTTGGRIARLEKATRKVRRDPARQRNVKFTDARIYARWRELNRYVLQECFPEHTPRRRKV